MFVHVLLPIFLLLCASLARAQGPAPETAPPLFPGGALISYNSIFTTRGLMSNHQERFRRRRVRLSRTKAISISPGGSIRNFDLTVLVPVVTNHFDVPGANAPVGNRIWRLHGAREIPLLPARLTARDHAGIRHVRPKDSDRRDGPIDDNREVCLPASLQPGSGSTDFFIAANWTYTGLFNLQAAGCGRGFSLPDCVRRERRATRLGSDLESRFWLSYRPYESKNVAREWFIGPVLTWLHSQDDRIAGVTSERKRWRRAAGGNHDIRRRSSGNARLGSGWIGMLHIPRARCSCPFAATSVSGSRSSFGFIFSGNNKEERWKCESSHY